MSSVVHDEKFASKVSHKQLEAKLEQAPIEEPPAPTVTTAKVSKPSSAQENKQAARGLSHAPPVEPSLTSSMQQDESTRSSRPASLPGAFHSGRHLEEEIAPEEETEEYQPGPRIPTETLIEAFKVDIDAEQTAFHHDESTIVEAKPLKEQHPKRTRTLVAALIILIAVLLAVVIAVVVTQTSNTSSDPSSPLLPTVDWEPFGSAIRGWQRGEQAGTALALDSTGSILAVAALFYNGTNNTDWQGQVRVYHHQDNQDWVLRGSPIDGAAAGDQSGTAVALSSNGSILAVGAFLNDGINGTSFEAGHVRVYQYVNEDWIQTGRTIDGEAAEDRSGFSVALSSAGDILAIGSPGNDENGTFAGQARVFQFQQNDWVPMGDPILGKLNYSYFGEAVALSSNGTILAVGAFRYNGPAGQYSGQVRVFEYRNQAWIQRGSDLNGEHAGDWAGTSPSVVLSSDGTTIAIGATHNNGTLGLESGHVRVFDYVDKDWKQRGLDINGLEAGEEFGSSVAISSNGNRLVVGAEKNRQNGDQAGAVRVYQWFENQWVQLGSDFKGKEGDRAGTAVAMSSDGSFFAMGIPLSDDYDEDAGQVKMYRTKNG